jgi:hypothetical protein
LIRTKDLILHKFDLVEEFYSVNKKVKSWVWLSIECN